MKVRHRTLFRSVGPYLTLRSFDLYLTWPVLFILICIGMYRTWQIMYILLYIGLYRKVNLCTLCIMLAYTARPTYAHCALYWPIQQGQLMHTMHYVGLYRILLYILRYIGLYSTGKLTYFMNYVGLYNPLHYVLHYMRCDNLVTLSLHRPIHVTV
jgi:hypothetical protein